MSKPALLSTGPMMALITDQIEAAFDVHWMHKTPDVDALIRDVGPRIEAVRVVDALTGAPNSNDAFEERFGAHRFIPGADTTIEMSVDASGRVAGFDRVYRGAYPLPAVPW